VDAALALRPDLISISAGGNDIIRPGTDPDEVANRLDAGIERLRNDGATVVMFNGSRGVRPASTMWRGRASTSARGSCGASATNRRATGCNRNAPPTEI